MPEIGLANDVTIDYDEDEVDIGSGYRFERDVPELGEFATAGTRFTLTARRDDPEKEGYYIYSFETENTVEFQLVEETFSAYLDEGTIVNLD